MQKTVLDGLFSISSIVLLLGLAVSVFTIIRFFKQNSREAAEDARIRTNEILSEVRENRKTEDDRFREIEGRVRAAETRMERFVPGDVIDSKIEHLKANRITIELRHEERLKEISECVSRHGEQLAKMEERHTSMAATVQRVEMMLTEQGKDMRAGFEKMQEALHQRSALA